MEYIFSVYYMLKIATTDLHRIVQEFFKVLSNIIKQLQTIFCVDKKFLMGHFVCVKFLGRKKI